jgi:hypothetical protein
MMILFPYPNLMPPQLHQFTEMRGSFVLATLPITIQQKYFGNPMRKRWTQFTPAGYICLVSRPTILIFFTRSSVIMQLLAFLVQEI